MFYDTRDIACSECSEDEPFVAGKRPHASISGDVLSLEIYCASSYTR